MDFRTYQNEAARTCPDLGERDNKMHMLMGMVTEVGEVVDVFKKNLAYGKEVDWVNVKEEIGDCYWYVANFCRMSGWQLQDLVAAHQKSDDNLSQLTLGMPVIVATTIMAWVSGKDVLIRRSFETVVSLLLSFAEVAGFDTNEQLERNIAKLRSRYPDKFSQDAALNRDLDKERAILEGNK